VRVKLGEQWRDGATSPYYGNGPLWLICWWHICGFFYGRYWDAYRKLGGWPSE
jgi:hypothetical protein